MLTLNMHINALVRRKRDMAALKNHNMWYSALGVRWKRVVGVLPHMGVFPRPTLSFILINAKERRSVIVMS